VKRIAWATDIHLNFLEARQVEEFCRRVAATEPDGLMLSGDIGEAPSVGSFLRLMEETFDFPVYFVLGNHDFYYGSLASVREEIGVMARGSDRLHWLSESEILPLTETTCLLGHDSWADGRIGDFAGSDVVLSDHFLISDLAGLDRAGLLGKMNLLGNEAAAHVRRLLPSALERFRHAVVLTHVPPFRDSCWYGGKISEDDWLPHFSCKAVGDALEEIMRRHPDNQMTVLCGHTHGSGTAQILPNLLVRTGGAVYGKPRLQDPVIVE
jgi:predicted MPP superfamily phosphohydrolase